VPAPAIFARSGCGIGGSTPRRPGDFRPFWVQFVLLVAFETRFRELAQPVPPNAPKKAPVSDFLLFPGLREPVTAAGCSGRSGKRCRDPISS
jgi:hypothetical protein